MIACNLARMVSLGSIPVSFFLGTLSLTQIFVVVLVTGAFEVVARTAYQAYLPSVVAREDLLEANQKMSFTGSASSLIGPGIAGYLYQLVGGAASIIIDSVGFLASAIILRGNKEEVSTSLRASEENLGFFRRLGNGL